MSDEGFDFYVDQIELGEFNELISYIKESNLYHHFDIDDDIIEEISFFADAIGVDRKDYAVALLFKNTILYLENTNEDD